MPIPVSGLLIVSLIAACHISCLDKAVVIIVASVFLFGFIKFEFSENTLINGNILLFAKPILCVETGTVTMHKNKKLVR
ncbi:hypothetical protein FM036_31745 [Nostoc sp. HG1]|nr:hypothetical protein [Nostoc sp. HG1]